MVRLRLKIAYDGRTLYSISIPHGTIKTKWTKPVVELTSIISIPHGTIKTIVSGRWCCRWSPISIPHGTIKTTLELLEVKDKPISIPHGTIKTNRFRELFFQLFKFQFHMVRLRRFRLSRILFRLRTFQFHMVRLRQRLRNHIQCRRTISIPHGTIKTERVLQNHVPLLDFNSTWYD